MGVLDSIIAMNSQNIVQLQGGTALQIDYPSGLYRGSIGH